MSTTPPKLFTEPASPGKRRFTLKVVLLVGGGLAAVGVVAPVVGQMPSLQLPPPSAVADKPTDAAATTRVQAALAADPALKPHSLSLLVNVMDGVAVIGGPVPSESLVPHIKTAAAAVPGVAAVRVTAWVPAPSLKDDAFVQRVGDRLGEQKPAADTSRSSSFPALAIPSEGPKPRPRTDADLTMADPPGTRPAATVTARHTPTAVLLDPVASVDGGDRRSAAPVSQPGSPSPAPPVRVPGAAPLPYPTIPPTKLPTRPVSDDGGWTADPAARTLPPADVLGVVRGDPRFAALTADVRAGTATVGGAAAKFSIVWDFADRLRALPTVDEVVIGTVRIR